jgi:hypothetical protein
MLTDETFLTTMIDDSCNVQHNKSNRKVDIQQTENRHNAAHNTYAHCELSTISCRLDEHAFAIDYQAVKTVTSAICASAPPWAKPWIAGLSWVQNNLVVVIDPLGHLRALTKYQPVPVKLVVMRAKPYEPHWAIAVDSACEELRSLHGVLRQSCLPVDWHCPKDWFHEVIPSEGMSVTVLNHNAVMGAIAHRCHEPDAA